MVLTRFQTLHYDRLYTDSVQLNIISSSLELENGMDHHFIAPACHRHMVLLLQEFSQRSTPQVQSICTIRVGVHTSQIAQYGIIPMTGYYIQLYSTQKVHFHFPTFSQQKSRSLHKLCKNNNFYIPVEYKLKFLLIYSAFIYFHSSNSAFRIPRLPNPKSTSQMSPQALLHEGLA